MKKSIHSEAEIIKSVKELEGGMDVSQLRKLKHMYADLALDNHILREVIGKKL